MDENFVRKNGLIYSPNLKTVQKIDASSSEFRGTVSNGAEAVGDRAFAECPLTDIFLPDSVRRIGGRAFENSARLVSVRLPSGLRTLPPYLFSGCKALTRVDMPLDVDGFSEGLFSGCESLTEIPFRAGIRELPSGVFAGCTSLVALVIPDSVTAIRAGAVSGCARLTTVVLPSSLEILEDGAFSGCTKLSHIRIHGENRIFRADDDDCRIYKKNPDGTETLVFSVAERIQSEIPEFSDSDELAAPSLISYDQDDDSDDDTDFDIILSPDELKFLAENPAAAENAPQQHGENPAAAVGADEKTAGASEPAAAASSGADNAASHAGNAAAAENAENTAAAASAAAENAQPADTEPAAAASSGADNAASHAENTAAAESAQPADTEPAAAVGADEKTAGTSELAAAASSGADNAASHAGNAAAAESAQPADTEPPPAENAENTAAAENSNAQPGADGRFLQKLEDRSAKSGRENTGAAADGRTLFVFAETLSARHDFSARLVSCCRHLAAIRGFARIYFFYRPDLADASFRAEFRRFMEDKDTVVACQSQSLSALSEYAWNLAAIAGVALDRESIAAQISAAGRRDGRPLKLLIQDSRAD